MSSKLKSYIINKVILLFSTMAATSQSSTLEREHVVISESTVGHYSRITFFFKVS